MGVKRLNLEGLSTVGAVACYLRTPRTSPVAQADRSILLYMKTAPGLSKMDHKIKVPGKKGKVPSGKKMSEVDETHWCGCFIMWCLGQAGIKVRGLAMAKDWWFQKDKHGLTPETNDNPRIGSITVMSHALNADTAGTTDTGFHVGLYVGGPPTTPVILGGNQSNSVCRKQFLTWDLVGFVWPTVPSK